MNDRKPNQLYWAYNLPLQYWPASDESDAMILNYMPRKESVCEIGLDTQEQTHEEFFNTAADYLENLAKHFRIAAKDPSHTIYYHDKELPTNP